MDWKLALSTFGIVFLAELGDKTQLAALALTGRSGRPLSVFVGAGGALLAATLLGVLLGSALRKFMSEKTMSLGAAVLFIAVGVWLLVRTLAGGGEAAS
ncbi:MAG TPA: TMEM165/GDT1 family protein [Planctomycetota bacterium]|nr:TMEM165/GDT1 family protein [Planctomycetota bacterium]